MAEPTIAELDEQIALNRQRFEQVVQQIRGVLQEDLANFVAREAKKAFLSNPDAAATLSKAQVADLKRRSAETARTTAARVAGALAEDGPWLAAYEAPTDARSLVEATEVWAVVQTADSDLAALLGDFGLATGVPAYKAPAYFVGGLYFPSLAEHYWKIHADLAALQGEKEQLHDTTVRAALEDRWDEA